MYSTHEILSIVSKSGVLGKTGRQYKLLEYLLEKKDQGQIDDIKAYGIALDVFGRPSNFESSQDSIVRVEMFRLRKNLKAFNSTSENFTLRLPKTSYCIEIEQKKTELKAISFFMQRKFLSFVLVAFIATVIMSGAVYWLSHPQMKYSSLCSDELPNVVVITNPDVTPMGSIIYNGYTSALARQTGVNLIEPAKICSPQLTPFYKVHIDALFLKGLANTSITTSQGEIGNVIHSTVIDEMPLKNQTSNALFYAAVRAANDLGKMNGVIPRHAGRLSWGANSAQANYNCIIMMYDSFVTDSNEDYIQTVQCLEKAMDNGLPPIANIGALSTLYLAQNRGGREKTVQDPLNATRQLLGGVGGNWIDNVETVMATIYFEAERDDYSSERLKDTLNIAETHYPLNPQVLTIASVMYGFRLGDWNQAKKLSELVKLIHSERDNSVLMVDAAYALLTLPAHEVMETCILTVSEHSISSNIIIHTCARIAGDKAWAEKTRANLFALGLKSPEEIIDFVVNRPFDAVLTAKIIDIIGK